MKQPWCSNTQINIEGPLTINVKAARSQPQRDGWRRNAAYHLGPYSTKFFPNLMLTNRCRFHTTLDMPGETTDQGDRLKWLTLLMASGGQISKEISIITPTKRSATRDSKPIQKPHTKRTQQAKDTINDQTQKAEPNKWNYNKDRTGTTVKAFHPEACRQIQTRQT
jgi:hypothetical protein